MTDLQTAILEIFRQVKAICDNLGVRCFAVGGTAIGAVRHGGFIPWDDDLDIAIPIEDYERFCAEVPGYLPPYLELRSYRTTIHNQNVFSKVIDVRTTDVEPIEMDYPDAYKGVFIDVLPMSGVPSCSFLRKGFTAKAYIYGVLAMGLAWRWNDCSTAKRKAVWVVSRLASPFCNSQAVLQKWEKLLISQPFDKAEYVGYTWWPKVAKLVFPKAWFDGYVLMDFEDTEIRMPIGYDEYLRKQFGDYMQLPPEEQRYTHHGFIDLEHSYRDYRDGLRSLPRERE